MKRMIHHRCGRLRVPMLLAFFFFLSISPPASGQYTPMFTSTPASSLAPPEQATITVKPCQRAGRVMIFHCNDDGTRGALVVEGMTDVPYPLPKGKYTIQVYAKGGPFSYYFAELPGYSTLTSAGSCEPRLEQKRMIRWNRVITLIVAGFVILIGMLIYFFRGYFRSRIRDVIIQKDIEMARTTVLRDGVPERIGDFKVLDKLGQGGMAMVYRVQDTHGDVYALKVPHAHVFSVPEYRERFIREAEIIKKLHHPSIVRMFDYSLGENYSIPYICMEYVLGQSLKAFMDKNPVLPIKRVAKIIIDVASALGYAHEKGIVHRDIKPENIMITKKNEIKLMDLGIARASESKTLTATGMTLGTPYYLAPEQVESKMVDRRADLYSLGVVLYEMLTAHLPFDSDEPINVVIMHINDDPPPPTMHNAMIPKDLEAMVLKLLEKNPKDRYQSAEELIDALKRYA
jgi:tRNA A-37 threonylcarbamoyl transferase component Bud32